MTGRQHRLSPAEAELWAQVARTVRPIDPASLAALPEKPPVDTFPVEPQRRVQQARATASRAPAAAARPARSLGDRTLDARWDRQLARGLTDPDFTIDLHGASLDGAYTRLDQGLSIALAEGARLVLLITGRMRGQAEPADRGSQRGAIRAKCLDWLTQGSHASRIAAIRPAHPRHGGSGAIYIVLRRQRA